MRQDTKRLNLVLSAGVALLLALAVFAAETDQWSGGGSAGQGAARGTHTAESSGASLSGSEVGGSGVQSASTWPFSRPTGSVQRVATSAAVETMSEITPGARVFEANDTISFGASQDVTILVLGMMPEDARNLTGTSPPGYATDDVFVVGGLIDPTLVITEGATIHLVFVNLDDDMYHNFVVTSLFPPYGYMPLMGVMSSGGSQYGGMMGGGSGASFASTMPLLSPAADDQGLASYYTMSMTLSDEGGSYWYICTYPGHAQDGMYGRIVVG